MGVRRNHRLSRNCYSSAPREIVFFDTETILTPRKQPGDFEQKLRLGVACYLQLRDDRTTNTEVWCNFTTIKQFWDFVFSHARDKQRLIIMAHNLSFDAQVVKLFSTMLKHKYEPKKIILDYRKQIWRFRKDKHTILYLDSMNLFPVSLESLGESIGIPKLDMPSDEAPKSEWFTYCKNDVMVIKEAMVKWLSFLTDNDLGNFANTLASQAMNAYRHRFMPQDLYIHCDPNSVPLERDSYRGGRSECFHLGKLPPGKYYMLDINSQYPYVMLKNDYPYSFLGYYKNTDRVDLGEYFNKYAITAKVIIETDTSDYAVRHDNRLIFPIGEFKVSLNTPELIHAYERGRIKKVLEFSLHRKADIFSDYVDFFYNSRLKFSQNGEPAYAYMCKIILNSLYGKFGGKQDEWVEIGYDPDTPYDYYKIIDAQTHEIDTIRTINHVMYQLVGTEEGYNSYVAVAAEVTANARMLLLEYMNKAGRENVYYVDTDSLLVNHKGYQNLQSLLDSTELGSLKLERSSNDVVLHGVKDYRFGDLTKIKGVNKNAGKLDETTYAYLQSRNLKGALHEQDLNTCLWRYTEKVLKRQYTKGTVNQDRSISPLCLVWQGDVNALDILD